MNIIIIEDEVLAAKKLAQLVFRYNPNFKILAEIRSVKDSVNWLRSNEMPDLIFMDIHLLDGSSFEILGDVELSCPVIFTTAYDTYALEAFKVHTVDYLLKPINFSKLEQAFQKLETIQNNIEIKQSARLDALLEAIQTKTDTYKNRFLIKSGSKMFSVKVKEVNHFYSEEKLTFLITHEGNRFVVDLTLDELEKVLNPSCFFRINRQMIIHIDSIKMSHKLFRGTLKIELNIDSAVEEVVVSSRRVSDFQIWLDR